MPRYYCDYCDTYLTHDSPSVRKQHNAGYKHKANVRTYYQQFEEQQTQSLIDQRIKEHLGQTAAFQQVGAAYNQHLASFPNAPRPRLPVLPTPGMPGALGPVFRPPILPRPMTGYNPAILAPPGAPSYPMQVNGQTRPPMSAPMQNPTSNGPPSMMAPVMYQPNQGGSTTAPMSTNNSQPSQDGYGYAQTSNANY